MNDWQERLPELPQERLHRAVVREGQARRHRRAERRRNAATVLGSVAGVLLLILGIASVSTLDTGDDGDTAAATTGLTRPTTAAPSYTTAGAAEATTPAETTAPAATTTLAPATGARVTVEPAAIFEASPSGASCGVERVQVTCDHPSGELASAIATLRIDTTEVSAPMVLAGPQATVTLGPLPQNTVANQVEALGTVTVTGTDTTGAPFQATAELLVYACTS